MLSKHYIIPFLIVVTGKTKCLLINNVSMMKLEMDVGEHCNTHAPHCWLQRATLLVTTCHIVGYNVPHCWLQRATLLVTTCHNVGYNVPHCWLQRATFVGTACHVIHSQKSGITTFQVVKSKTKSHAPLATTRDKFTHTLRH